MAHPISAFATIFVTLKSASLTLIPRFLWISFTIFFATILASFYDSDPMIIILPDLKTRIVLFGFVFLRITAGNLFLLYLEFSNFSAMSFKSNSLFYMSIRANETTFCTTGGVSGISFFKCILLYSNSLIYITTHICIMGHTL